MAITGTLIAEALPFLLLWVIGMIAAFFVPITLPFALGGLLFVIGELVTLDGIQVSPFSRHKVHVLKGMHRKGELSEYIFVALIAVMALILQNSREGEVFAPYMLEWEKFYEEGLIDGREWKEHRFDYF